MQETQWDPPAEGYQPIPPEWLSWSANEPASESTSCHTEPQADSQRSHPTAAALDLASQDSPLLQAEPQSEAEQQPGSAAAAVNLDGLSSIPNAVGQQVQAGHAMPARPESSGLMPSIPEPQGIHFRFDSDTDTHNSAADSLCQSGAQDQLNNHSSTPFCGVETSNESAAAVDHVQRANAPQWQQSTSKAAAQQPEKPIEEQHASVPDGHTQVAIASTHDNSPSHVEDLESVSEEHSQHFDPVAAQQAVQGIMSSTVVTAESIQQDPAPSNTPSTSHLPTSGALQQLIDFPTAVNLSDAAQHAHSGAEGLGDADQIETAKIASDDAGITFNSLSNQLQSKQELPRKLWKYWLQVIALLMGRGLVILK